MSVLPTVLRNPGPSWGYEFLLWAERCWPRWFFRPLLMAGTWVALPLMPAQRAHSRAYLTVVLGRPPGLVEVWRHFFAFADFLMFKLRAGRGVAVPRELLPENAAEFESLIASGRPALYGSFHFGCSDLLGYLLSDRGRHVSILRLRIGNAVDTRMLGARYGDKVSFLWVNDPANMLFDLKDALEAGESIALKCDRVEYSSRLEPFDFLGARRMFPFTIYSLAILFNRPVIFCIGVPDARHDGMGIVSSPVFIPDPVAGRKANTERARAHFQGVLRQLETLVRAHPYLWFNFLPLNPEAPAAPHPVSPNL
jgi:predicted LPLAT superfamily acyltransferase